MLFPLPYASQFTVFQQTRIICFSYSYILQVLKILLYVFLNTKLLIAICFLESFGILLLGNINAIEDLSFSCYPLLVFRR